MWESKTRIFIFVTGTILYVINSELEPITIAQAEAKCISRVELHCYMI